MPPPDMPVRPSSTPGFTMPLPLPPPIFQVHIRRPILLIHRDDICLSRCRHFAAVCGGCRKRTHGGAHRGMPRKTSFRRTTPCASAQRHEFYFSPFDNSSMVSVRRLNPQPAAGAVPGNAAQCKIVSAAAAPVPCGGKCAAKEAGQRRRQRDRVKVQCAGLMSICNAPALFVRQTAPSARLPIPHHHKPPTIRPSDSILFYFAARRLMNYSDTYCLMPLNAHAIAGVAHRPPSPPHYFV